MTHGQVVATKRERNTKDEKLDVIYITLCRVSGCHRPINHTSNTFEMSEY